MAKEENKSVELTEFEKTIKAYLDKMASEDEAFASKYANKDKTIQNCCSFIISEVQKQAQNGRAVMSDKAVYGLAVHYYEESNINTPKEPTKAEVVVATSEVEMSEEEIEEIKEQARQDYAKSQKAIEKAEKEAEEKRKQEQIKKIKEKEIAKLQEAKNKQIEKEKENAKKKEESGQLSLFDW